MNHLITTQKAKKVGVTLFTDLQTLCLFYSSNHECVFSLVINCYFFSSDHLSDDQLFGIMESICALVDCIPEHELIALSCGNELLLKRAQRCVHHS